MLVTCSFKNKLNKAKSLLPFVKRSNSDVNLSLVNNDEIEDSISYLNMYIPEKQRTACSEERIEVLENMINNFYLNDTVPSYANLKGFLDVSRQMCGKPIDFRTV